jgi:hypothetical protein
MAMKVEVLTGPQGGGKSTVMRNEAIAQPGLYLFALPTIELIEEQSSDLFNADKLLHTKKVHKDSGPGAVAKRLTEARKDFEAKGLTHGVIFITHETLMNHDLDGFDRWHARVDEAPAAVQAGRFNIGVSTRSWLKDSYEVVGAIGSDWSALKKKIEKPNWKAVERDEGARAFGEFIKQADQPDRVFVKTTSWDANDNIDWFSMWTPLALSHFASVQIAGSSYTDSVGYRAARALLDDKFVFSEREIAPARTKQPSISVHYFTQGHEGATTFWGTSEGRLRIKQVCDYLGGHLPDSAFWSGNEVVQHLMEHRLPGSLIRPMAMGINKHRQARDCAFIFSGKATPKDEPLKVVFGLSDNDIRHAREDDAVAQFAMRGAIRDLDFDGPYAIYLYSQSQAERLRDHLLKIGFTTVEIVGLDEAGLMDERREAPRPEATPEERAARVEQRKAKAVQRAKRNRDKKRAAKLASAQPT